MCARWRLRLFPTAPAATPALEACVSSGPDRSPWLSAAAAFPSPRNSGVAPCAPRQLSTRICQTYAGPPSCARTRLHKHKQRQDVDLRYKKITDHRHNSLISIKLTGLLFCMSRATPIGRLSVLYLDFSLEKCSWKLYLKVDHFQKGKHLKLSVIVTKSCLLQTLNS